MFWQTNLYFDLFFIQPLNFGVSFYKVTSCKKKKKTARVCFPAGSLKASLPKNCFYSMVNKVGNMLVRCK